MANKIRLIDISMRNFLSYGDNLTVFTFEDGFNLIKGANGNGKSTIIEAIFFALFGKSYRELTLGELINSYNGKNCYVRLRAEITNGTATDVYEIERGLKPKIFRITKNGVQLDEEGTGGVFQQYLQNEVLGFNEILFRNSIAIASSSSTPFLHMGAADKRKLIESILGISDLEKIKKAFSSELSDAKSQLKNKSTQLPIISSKISELREIMDKALAEKDTDISRLQLQLNQFTEELRVANIELSAISDDMKSKADDGKLVSAEYEGYKQVHAELGLHETQLKASTKSLERSEAVKAELLKSIEFSKGYTKKGYEALIAKRDELSSLLTNFDEIKGSSAVVNHQLKQLETQLEKHLSTGVNKRVGDCCPTCGKEATEADVSAIQKEFDATSKKLKSEITKYKNQYKSISAEIERLDGISKEFQRIGTEINEYHVRMTKFEDDSRQLNYVNEEIASHKQEISTAQKELDIIRPKIALADIISSRLNALRTEYFEIKTVHDTKVNAISSLKRRISELEATIQQKKNKDVDALISSTEALIEKAVADYALAKEEVKRWSDEIEMLEYISTIFGDEGIKEYMMKKYVPLLNHSIQKYMSIFGLQYTIEFDSLMELHFTSGAGQSKSYKGLSGGQKMRVDFSIYMAFRDFVNKIGRFRINVFFLDEMLDTAVDGTGYSEMMHIVAGMKDIIGCVYLISHRADESNVIFDSLIEMQHDGMFSSFTIRKH